MTNLVSSFRKTGIYPYSVIPVPPEMTNPSKIFARKVTDHDSKGNIDDFLSQKDIEHEFVPPVHKKPRKTLSKIVGGQCITDDVVFEKIQGHVSSRKGKSDGQTNCRTQGLSKRYKAPKSTNQSKPSSETVKNTTKHTLNDTNEAGPSRFYVSDDSISDTDKSDNDSDLCCVCKKYSPPGLHEQLYSKIVLVKWAQCDKCSHWTHLRFCCKPNVVRRSETFLCPCCIEEE